MLITYAAVITLFLLARFRPLHCVSDWVALHRAIELCSLNLNTAAKVAQEKSVLKVPQKLWLSCSSGLERDVAEREITKVMEKLVERQRERLLLREIERGVAEQTASNCSPSLFWHLQIYWKQARRTCWICYSRVPAFSAAARETNQCCFKSSWKLRNPWSPAAWQAAVQGLLSFQQLQRLHWQNVCSIWRSTMWQWKNLRETKRGRGRKEERGEN